MMMMMMIMTRTGHIHEEHRNDDDDDADNEIVCDFVSIKHNLTLASQPFKTVEYSCAALLKQTLKSNANEFVHPVQSIFTPKR